MADSRRTPGLRAAPPSKVLVPQDVPSPRSRGGSGPGTPQIWAPRWWGGALGALLLLSSIGWGILHGIGGKKQRELREELELLRENNSRNWAEAWQLLLQVQQQQTQLSRITDLLCRTLEGSQQCPSGWQFYARSCYFFSSRARSWSHARDFCRDRNAQLVVVNTEEEQLFLTNKTQENNSSYWMGLTDEQHEGKWVWVTGQSPTFGFWDVWEDDPEKELKDCGMMKANGRWSNERCSSSARWICEKPWDCNFSPLLPVPKKPAPAV